MASLSRVIEPHVVRRRVARQPVAEQPADQLAMAQTASRTSTMRRTDARITAEQWYRVEDPYTTAETDAAFAAFMAGDNPHVRTDEVPVVDFTSMIEQVGPDGRPIGQPPRQGSRVKLGLVALATAAFLAAASLFGFIDIPGVDSVVPDTFRSAETAPVNINDGN